jgi:hypothetical protein
MNIAIVFPFQPQYKMPLLCCICGSPAGKHTRQVQYTSRVGMVYDSTIKLGFPICDECANKEKLARQMGLAAALLFLAGFVIGTGVVVLLFRSFFNMPAAAIIAIVAMAILVLPIVLGLVGGRIIRKLMLKDRLTAFLEWRQRSLFPVKIVDFHQEMGKLLPAQKGYVAVQFANPSFGDLFKQLNGGIEVETK